MIIGIILAAGTSSRFNSETPKQLYSVNNKPIIEYSIDNMIDLVDKLINHPKKYSKADTIKILTMAADKLQNKA